jgi:uncharacterized protein YkwD
MMLSSLLILALSCGPLNQPDAREKISTRKFKDRLLSRLICHESNRVRLLNARSKLNNNSILDKGSSTHAVRMRDLDFIEHLNPYEPKLREPTDRVRRHGGKNPYVAENLAQLPIIDMPGKSFRVFVIDQKNYLYSGSAGGKPVPRHSYASFAREAVKSWMNSPGHRANLLNKENLEIGCGAAMVKKKNKVPMINAVQLFQGYEPLRSDRIKD